MSAELVEYAVLIKREKNETIFINEIHANVYNDKSKKTKLTFKNTYMNDATCTKRMHV